jgi:isoleucyl-tRNA synthetase
MSDTPEKPDYRSTVFLPKTDFPMKAGLAQKEPAILERWAKIGLYDRLRRERAGRDRFILHDGPPYANGDIHMGHAMNKVLKDVIVRSQSLAGKDAPYVPGWDCHGLPIEWKVEEAYRAKKLNKDEVDPVQFRAECRAYADKWVGTQRDQFKRLGVMGDWDDPYLTMTYEAEATIAAELLKFATSGQLYRGAKPVMWSPVEKTALAEAEVEYEDITSTQIDVAFEIVEAPNAPELVGAYAVIWTTTPWTIPVNQALAYGPEVEYVLFDLGQEAKGAFQTFFKGKILIARELALQAGERMSYMSEEGIVHDELPFGIATTFLEPIWEGKGADLAGAVARHPMHKLGGFFARPRPFLAGDFVTTDTGTGLVHLAPDHGEDDFLLCKQHGIDPVFAVEGDGRYRADWPWPEDKSLSVINKKLLAPDGPICTDLAAVGALLSARNDKSTQHSYPHSWRSKAPLIYRATPQWFIPMDRPVPGGLGDTAAPLCATEEEIRDQQGANTLRGVALAAIDDTRWVPAKSQNRIRAMVEGRPDWVISRQRAWGVPIALYVDCTTGDYLRDPQVNDRIIAAFRAGGADAWFTADHQAILGNQYRLEDHEVVTDILDVWFDSGSTHAFVVEQRFGPGTRASLYLEGSDQHRGWFQSSLLESCGTRGRAPYDAVLTHGFALDGQGRKMSKSLGNVVDPLKIIGESGADILRLWVVTTDYFDDVRIGKEVLAGTSDAYRKLRNTFRYLLGALEGFTAAERVAVDEMPELERYLLDRLARLDATLKAARDGFEFNRYMTALFDFANEDLSAFFFDIRKDSLYCDAPDSAKRRAYRTVLDTLFEALVRYVSPVLVFTAEEVWATRYPDADGSVHLLEWPEVGDGWRDDRLAAKWEKLRDLRSFVTGQIEPMRREKKIGSSLEADVTVGYDTDEARDMLASVDLAELFIVAQVNLAPSGADAQASVETTSRHKCGRCWRHLPDVQEDGDLCGRCTGVVAHG